ncbi:ATP-binding protein [Flavicella sp.]|uniref:AAA family ATPase n=1 Tax=Flavicella sp. TaxID=2957742 RepID=UPI00301A1904
MGVAKHWEMIHLIVGNTGSGKTTYSNKLKEKTKGIIFSIDKWNNILFLPDKIDKDGLEWFLERIERVETIISSLILQLERTERDSILDLGLSKFEHREKFRKFAKINNFEIKIHFLNISKETRLKRIFERNNEKGKTFEFEVTQENFEFMENWFEKPSEIELKNGILINE